MVPADLSSYPVLMHSPTPESDCSLDIKLFHLFLVYHQSYREGYTWYTKLMIEILVILYVPINVYGISVIITPLMLADANFLPNDHLS